MRELMVPVEIPDDFSPEQTDTLIGWLLEAANEWTQDLLSDSIYLDEKESKV